jgi:arginase family enzyme
MEKNIIFVKVPCHQSNRKDGYQLGCDFIKKQYHYTFDEPLFTKPIINFSDGHKFSKGFNNLYKCITDHLQSKKNDIMITIGGDNTLSISTCLAINDINNGNLKILYITPYPNTNVYDANTTNDINDMVIPSIMGNLIPPIVNCNNKYVISNQIILYGLQDDANTEYLDDKFIEYFKASKINKLGDDIFNEQIKDTVSNYPVHVILDMKIFGENYVTQDEYNIKNSLNYEHINKLLINIKNNIISMDITEFNPLTCTSIESKKVRELGRDIIKNVFDIKEKSINIINEHTQFLIYRPLEQLNSSDIGWYILSGLPISEMNNMLNLIVDDEIKTIDIDGEDYLVAKTSMDEQNNKTFYHAKSTYDITLFPNEKIDMCFRILDIKN